MNTLVKRLSLLVMSLSAFFLVACGGSQPEHKASKPAQTTQSKPYTVSQEEKDYLATALTLS